MLFRTTLARNMFALMEICARIVLSCTLATMTFERSVIHCVEYTRAYVCVRVFCKSGDGIAFIVPNSPE